jgi:radical SAM protein with 4Fe4S-binding SPASM domain
MRPNFDLNRTPLVVIWETTRACDLACFHCRACAQPQRNPLELSTAEGKRLIDEIAELNPPIFIFTGGDPLKRADIFELVHYASMKHMHPAMTPSATPLLTRDALQELKREGLHRLALSLDGPSAELHDHFRGVAGSFHQTLKALAWCGAIGLPVQINTSVTKRNIGELEKIMDVIRDFKVVMWSLFFMVPTGRAELSDVPSAEECEDAFERLLDISRRVPFKVKTTEAPHYRRYVLQHRRASESISANGVPGILPINEAKGFVFISHTGEVQPSGFLPISAGNVLYQNLTDIYRDSQLFCELRNSDNLTGKCRLCEFRDICGGSRARAYAMTGDVFASDPCCVYQPRQMQAV